MLWHPRTHNNAFPHTTFARILGRERNERNEPKRQRQQQQPQPHRIPQKQFLQDKTGNKDPQKVFKIANWPYIIVIVIQAHACVCVHDSEVVVLLLLLLCCFLFTIPVVCMLPGMFV